MPEGQKWTLESVLDHLSALIVAQDEKTSVRFDAMEAATRAALKSAEQAVLKAETAAEKRFESVNEFRNTLADQQRNLIPRSEFDVTVKALEDKVGLLQAQMQQQRSEQLGVKGGWGYAVGVVGLLLALGSLIMIGIKFVTAQ